MIYFINYFINLFTFVLFSPQSSELIGGTSETVNPCHQDEGSRCCCSLWTPHTKSYNCQKTIGKFRSNKSQSRQKQLYS